MEMRLITLTLIFVLFILGCTPKAVHNPTAARTETFVTAESSHTPTEDWLALRSTERVGTVLALQTASTTPLPTRRFTQTPTPQPTPTFNPKYPLIHFIMYPNDGADEITNCLDGLATYRFALYQDGRFILFDNGRYLATSVSSSEIEKLLQRIEATGFFAISGYDNQYIPDSPTPSSSGGWGSSIEVRDHNVTIEYVRQDYLVNPVLEVLDIIAEFRPSGLRTYQPDRVTVWAFQNTSFENFIPTPAPPILNWPIENFFIEHFTDGPHVVSGDTVSFLLKEVGDIPAFRTVQQENQYYQVLVCPAFDANQ